MKLVHKSLTAAAAAACAFLTSHPSQATAQGPATSPAYVAFYNPAAGFKPAQPSLTQIFLQIAGSLEYSGSPEGYIRHMQQEHARISKKFSASTGQSHVSRLPAHMTPEYLDRLVSNWKVLSPKLGLEELAMEAGRCTRKAIRGTSDKGTVVITIFNEHQAIVANAMEKGIWEGADYEHLQSRLEAELELLPSSEAAKIIASQQERYFTILAEKEQALNQSERADYITFLRLPRFRKADFAELERFYKKPYDKLSKEGKDEMSHRVWSGTRPDDSKAIKTDAISAANEFLSTKAALFGKIDSALPPEKATKIKAAIDGVFRDLGRLAHSELEIAILEYAIGK